MKTILYDTNFGERRKLYRAEDGTYSPYPNKPHGNLTIREGLVYFQERELEVGELTPNSKQLLQNETIN